MKAHKIIGLIVVIATSLGFSSGSWAVTVPNPSPAIYGPDIGGSGLFNPDPFAFSVELLDAPDPFLPGSTFGFFYTVAPNVLIPLFEADDITPDPNAPSQLAIVNFITGEIVDGDSGEVDLVSDFLGFVPANPTIGFYFQLNDPLFQAVYGGPFSTAPGGDDNAGAFPLIGLPNWYAISFAALAQGENEPDELGTYLVAGIAPSPIPVPAAVWLFGTALIGLLGMRRKLSVN